MDESRRKPADKKSQRERQRLEDERIDEASKESFPASDPPSFMSAGKPGNPR
jgi:hypothetical protein